MQLLYSSIVKDNWEKGTCNESEYEVESLVVAELEQTAAVACFESTVCICSPPEHGAGDHVDALARVEGGRETGVAPACRCIYLFMIDTAFINDRQSLTMILN